MSQMVTRKTAEEKDKRQTASPVKEMKKKLAANAEKEKQAAEKHPDKPAEKTEKPAEKHAEKTDKKAEKHVDKAADKKTEKNGEKSDKKTENKQAEKKEGHVEKKDAHTEKKDAHAEKKDAHTEKKDAHTEKKEDNKGEKSGKSDKEPRPSQRPKQNGARAHNGVSDVTLAANGCERDVTENGTVSDEDDAMLVLDYDHERDELFPELSYDDTSDGEGEPGAAAGAAGEAGEAGRSCTRRSQVKVARTPETPRPASDKQSDKEASADDSKDSKILKLKDDANTDRKLRSADSPKDAKKSESPKKDKEGENGGQEVDVIIEIEDDEPRKPDTNYSKSRVKVSPYRRHTRLADLTASSVAANYTGNNTTMEMDITGSSFADEPALDDSSYLGGLRAIRGRRSYKELKDITLRHVNRSARSAANLSGAESTRPTGTVVGRKRKPEGDDSLELALEAEEAPAPAPGPPAPGPAHPHGKRMRLLERIAQPFRRPAASTPLPARRAAEIVGINTDLPLTAPVSSPDTFDPETLKPAAALPAPPPPAAAAELAAADRDPKRCVVM